MQASEGQIKRKKNKCQFSINNKQIHKLFFVWGKMSVRLRLIDWMKRKWHPPIVTVLINLQLLYWPYFLFLTFLFYDFQIMPHFQIMPQLNDRRKKKKKNPIIFAIICHVVSWVISDWGKIMRPPPLTTHHIINCVKNYGIFDVFSIAVTYTA